MTEQLQKDVFINEDLRYYEAIEYNANRNARILGLSCIKNNVMVRKGTTIAYKINK